MRDSYISFQDNYEMSFEEFNDLVSKIRSSDIFFIKELNKREGIISYKKPYCGSKGCFLYSPDGLRVKITTSDKETYLSKFIARERFLRNLVIELNIEKNAY